MDTDGVPAREDRVGDLVQNSTEAVLVRQVSAVIYLQGSHLLMRASLPGLSRMVAFDPMISLSSRPTDNRSSASLAYSEIWNE